MPKVYEKGHVLHITTIHNVLGYNLDSDSGSELDYEWVIKNPLPFARRTHPPCPTYSRPLPNI